MTAAMLARPDVGRRATIYSDSKSALQAIANPKLHSGQRLVRRIHEAIRLSRLQGRDIRINWIPGHHDIAGNEKAHQLAAETTEPEAAVTPVPWLDACYRSAILGRPPDTGLETRLNQSWTTGRHLRQALPFGRASSDSHCARGNFGDTFTAEIACANIHGLHHLVTSNT